MERACGQYAEWIKLLAAIRNELVGQPFSARYPGYGPGAIKETVPGQQPLAGPLGF
jgi:hypothetical protein